MQVHDSKYYHGEQVIPHIGPWTLLRNGSLPQLPYQALSNADNNASTVSTLQFERRETSRGHFDIRACPNPTGEMPKTLRLLNHNKNWNTINTWGI